LLGAWWCYWIDGCLGSFFYVQLSQGLEVLWQVKKLLKSGTNWSCIFCIAMMQLAWWVYWWFWLFRHILCALGILSADSPICSMICTGNSEKHLNSYSRKFWRLKGYFQEILWNCYVISAQSKSPFRSEEARFSKDSLKSINS
jgi:hypothetical protein